MIPPFVIALTATLFKDRFEVRKDALMNYINGISFISEGAIPFIQKRISNNFYQLVAFQQDLQEHYLCTLIVLLLHLMVDYS